MQVKPERDMIKLPEAFSTLVPISLSVKANKVVLSDPKQVVKFLNNVVQRFVVEDSVIDSKVDVVAAPGGQLYVH